MTCLAFILAVIISTAQNSQHARIIKNARGIIQSVEFDLNNNNQSTPKSSTDFFKEWLKVSPEVEFVKESFNGPDKQGYSDEHYDQYYKGIKVKNGGYNFHYKNGEMYFAHGNYVKINSLNIASSIAKEMAYKKFAEEKGIPLNSIKDFDAELMIIELKDEQVDTLFPPKLVYRTYLKSDHRNNSDIGYIDATSGELIYSEPKIIELGGTGTFQTRYYGTKQGYTENYDNVYHLEDYSRAAKIYVHRVWYHYLPDTSFIDPVNLITDFDNNWTQAELAANKDDMGLDIFWTLQKIHDHLNGPPYYKNSYDNNGHPVYAFIHYADWDPKKLTHNHDFAGWSLDKKYMVFGDGDLIYKPLASIDVVGHEFGHGINQFQIGWPYTGITSIMEEGLADIWGATFEYRISPTSVWEMADLVMNNGDDCRRNMQDTHDGNASYEMANTYASAYYNDHGGTYERSGVISHWYYLLVEGGSGYNELNNYYNVTGVGMDLAEQLLVKAVYHNFLDNTTDIPQLRESFRNAALSLTNNVYNSFVQSVENAWYAAGIGIDINTVSISGSSNLVCYNTESEFTINAPQGDTVYWYCGPNLTLPNGNTGTSVDVKATNPSTATYETITAKFVHDGHSYTRVKTVWAGNPSISQFDIYNPNPPFNNLLEPGMYNQIIANDYAYQTSTHWEWDCGGWYHSDVTGTKYITYVDVPYSFSYHDIKVRLYNTCGASNWYTERFYPYEGFFLIFSPNPSTGETVLSIVSASTGKTFDETTEWEMEVYSETQLLKEKRTKLKGKNYTIQTYGWQDGIYIVRVKYKEEVLTGKLVVKKL